MQTISLQEIMADNLDCIHYEDANYDYYCRAFPGTARAATSWIVKRISKTTDDVRHAGGSREAKWAATDLATVAAYSYTD
jgi:hypothetical protein